MSQKLYHRSVKFRAAVLVCASWALLACAHYPVPKGPSMGKPEAPPWTARDGTFWVSASSGTFEAAAAVLDIPDRRRAGVAADDRAVLELAKLLDSYAERLSLRLSTAAAQTVFEAADRAGKAALSLKAFGRTALLRASCPDHWWDRKAKSLHALCRLELAALKAAAEKSPELAPELRELVRSQADKSFADAGEP